MNIEAVSIELTYLRRGLRGWIRGFDYRTHLSKERIKRLNIEAVEAV